MKTKLSILGVVVVSFALLTVGCGRETEQPTEAPIATTEVIPAKTPTDIPTVVPTVVPSAIPTEIEVEVSEWVLAARQSTIDYISEQYGEDAPALDLTWTGGIRSGNAYRRLVRISILVWRLAHHHWPPCRPTRTDHLRGWGNQPGHRVRVGGRGGCWWTGDGDTRSCF